MAHGLFIGASGVAKKARQAYIGVNGVAKKIKKIYIGDANGKARTLFTEGGYTVIDTGIATLNRAKQNIAAVSLANQKAIFCSGMTNSYISGDVNLEIYDTSLTKTTVQGPWATTTSPNQDVGIVCNTNNFDNAYVYIVGGTVPGSGSNVYSGTVTMYDNQLTRLFPGSNPTFRSSGMDKLTCISAFKNQYGILANGYNSYNGGSDGTGGGLPFMYWVTTPGSTANSPHHVLLNNGIYVFSRMGGWVGNVAILNGGMELRGQGWYPVAACELYTNTTTKTAITGTLARNGGKTARAGSYLLFAGGFTGAATSTPTNVIEVFDGNGTKVNSTLSLSVARGNLASGTLGNTAYFVGGGTSGYGYNNFDVVDIIDSSLTRTTTNISTLKYSYTATANVGDYLLFAGGINTPGSSTSTSVFTNNITAIKQ